MPRLKVNDGTCPEKPDHLNLVQQMADNHSAELLFGRSALGGALVTIRFPR